ncbi:hypothetical protein K6I33_002608, partial [Streptomyces sp. UNOB3_S3]|nr:hypothetical protein [Streptomyces sp. UNOB3_S3]
PLPGTAPTTTPREEAVHHDPEPYETEADDPDEYERPDEDGTLYEDEYDIDPEHELPDVTEVVQLAERPSEKPRERISPSEARRVMEEILDEFEAEGRTIVRPNDFMRHCDRHGRSRSWVSGQVAAFIMAGRLTETGETGEYRIVRDDEAA